MHATLRSTLAAAVVGLCFTGTALADDTTYFNGTIRDFKGLFDINGNPTPGGHVHFEQFDFDATPNVSDGTIDRFPNRYPQQYFQPVINIGGTTYNTGGLNQVMMLEPGIVGTNLGLDGKPVWVGGSNAALFPSTKTKLIDGFLAVDVSDAAYNAARFYEWYNDTPGVNMSTAFGFELTKGEDGNWEGGSTSFFPIDDMLFGNEQRSHNYHFTMELHADVVYKGGETIEVTSDDDTFIFVNGKLVLDAGGVHKPLTNTVALDDIAEMAGLEVGEEFQLDLFYAERNTKDAAFAFRTNLDMPDVPTAMPLPGAVWAGLATLPLVGYLKRRARRSA